MLTAFCPTDTLPKSKVHKAFIPHPGLMYCQVRSYALWRVENTKAVF